MIQKEFYTTREDGVRLYITYSDAGLMIAKKSKRFNKQSLYKTAVDVENAPFEYIETDKPIKFTKKEEAIMKVTGRKYVLPNESLDIE